MTTVTVRIGGMGCGHCVDAVRRGLEAVAGVTVHAVTIGEARVTFDEHTTSRKEIDDSIRKAGYEPESL